MRFLREIPTIVPSFREITHCTEKITGRFNFPFNERHIRYSVRQKLYKDNTAEYIHVFIQQRVLDSLSVASSVHTAEISRHDTEHTRVPSMTHRRITFANCHVCIGRTYVRACLKRSCCIEKTIKSRNCEGNRVARACTFPFVRTYTRVTPGVKVVLEVGQF